MPDSDLMPWERVGPQFKKSYKRAGMLVDLDRCIGCHSCSVSCKTENDVPLGNFRMRVRYLEQPDNKQISFTPLICMHCVDAPCLKACPSKAIKKGVWWSKKNGGIGGGVHINDALPINPAPLTGGQNWHDNVCKV